MFVSHIRSQTFVFKTREKPTRSRCVSVHLPLLEKQSVPRFSGGLPLRAPRRCEKLLGAVQLL